MQNDRKKSITPNKKNKIDQGEQSTQPLGSLIQEIDSLKKQLKSIKSKKQIKVLQKSDLYNYSSQKSGLSINNRMGSPENQVCMMNHTIEENDNSRYQRIELDSISYPSKDKKLKMDIEINKLRKIVQRGKPEHIATQINIVFSLVNLYNQQLIKQYSKFKENYENQQLDYAELKIHNNYELYKEKYKALARTNQKLEDQVTDLRKKISKALDSGSQDCMAIPESSMMEKQPKLSMPKLQEQYNIIYKENRELAAINVELRQSIMGLTQKLETAYEKVKIYETNIEKKESQLVLMEQDVNYLRIQSEKFRQQKKEMDRIYEQTSKKYRELKINFESEVDRLEREKSKLQNQLKLRRQESEQILELESQKNHLYKEVEYMRQELNKKSAEASQMRVILQEQQKKSLISESQLYRTRADYEKLERNFEYSKGQINSLYQEVEQLQKANDRHRTVFKSKSNKDQPTIQRQQKMKALEQIHNMIKRHKQQVEFRQ